MSQADPAASSSQQPQQASSTVHILSLLLRLRQCCCHLSLLKKVHTHSHALTRLTGFDILTRLNTHKNQHKHWFPSFAFPLLSKTLDSSELQGDGIVLSLEEQLSALSLSSNSLSSGPDPKDTVALNGTRFHSKLFEETSESSKVGNRCSQHLKTTITPWMWECVLQAVCILLWLERLLSFCAGYKKMLYQICVF